MGRGDLSNVQWAALEPLLPITVLGRPSSDRQKLINGIRRRVRPGDPWRDLPPEYGPWQTVAVVGHSADNACKVCERDHPPGLARWPNRTRCWPTPTARIRSRAALRRFRADQ
ncbi:transposase [Streptomyces sp. NPDC055056]